MRFSHRERLFSTSSEISSRLLHLGIATPKVIEGLVERQSKREAQRKEIGERDRHTDKMAKRESDCVVKENSSECVIN